MNAHFKKNGWIYGLLFLLIAWPWAVWRLQQVPPLDQTAIVTLVERIDAEAARSYGPPLGEEYDQVLLRHPLLGSTDAGMNQDPRAQLLEEEGWRAADSVTTETQTLSADLDPAIGELTQLAGKGKNYRLLAPALRAYLASKKTSADFNNLLAFSWGKNLSIYNMQNALKLECMRAVLDLHDGRTQEGLNRLSRTASFADGTLSEASIIDFLVRAAGHQILAKSYAAALQGMPVNAPQDRAALDSLLALRAQDPRLTGVIMDLEKRINLATEIQGNQSDATMMLYAVERLSKPIRVHINLASGQPAALQDATLRNGASLLSNRQLVRWTLRPAAHKFIQTVLRREPKALLQVLDSSPEMEMEQGLDGWTMALLSGAQYFNAPNYVEWLTRGRVPLTVQRLMELAFASRLYFADHQAWPARVEDLATYLPPDSLNEFAQAQPNERLGLSTGPYFPYQLGWLSSADSPSSNKNLWAEFLPFRSAQDLQRKDVVGENPQPPPLSVQAGPFEWIFEGPVSRVLPALVLAIAQELESHPRLVAAPAVEYRMQKTDTWHALDAGAARDWTDATMAKFRDFRSSALVNATAPLENFIKNSASARSFDGAWHPPGWRSPGNSPTPSQSSRPENMPQAFRITGTLQAPKRAFAIWSPGPSGQDTGGSVTYDPTNGTLSRGDLIVYPEGY